MNGTSPGPVITATVGDLVEVRLCNDSVARNGVAATGSPWWVDSLNVRDGETYDIAFRADNPGIWMDHCHHLQHAADGMVAHLMYEGVTTPYAIGRGTPNYPE